MKKSCLNCKPHFICSAFDKLYAALNSKEYHAAMSQSKGVPGVHGECYQATASVCSYYTEDADE